MPLPLDTTCSPSNQLEVRERFQNSVQSEADDIGRAVAVDVAEVAREQVLSDPAAAMEGEVVASGDWRRELSVAGGQRNRHQVAAEAASRRGNLS
jgi:hypothetical protein